jgi:hypothetical protein
MHLGSRAAIVFLTANKNLTIYNFGFDLADAIRQSTLLSRRRVLFAVQVKLDTPAIAAKNPLIRVVLDAATSGVMGSPADFGSRCLSLVPRLVSNDWKSSALPQMAA